MKVLVLLRSLLFSEVLRAAICREEGFEARTPRCLTPTDRFEPDVILADRHALAGNRHQDWSNGKVLLIDTGLSEEEILQMMRDHKLYGVFSLEEEFRQLKKAITVINAGQIWIDNEKLKVILHGADTLSPDNSVEKLSSKESRIVELVAEGYKNREIASRLFLSEQTIKSHLGRIFRKVHVKSRSQLISLIMKSRHFHNNRDFSNAS